jgi:hypothetical protein
MTPDDPTKATDRRRHTVYLLGLFTILFFGVGGVLLMRHVQGRSPLELLVGPADPGMQLLWGAVAGLVIGFAAWGMVAMRFMDPVRAKYAKLIGPLMARRSDRLFVSVCAGVGEELFFRGALQWWLGIPITAVLFVAIHGYLDPRNWRISIYGVFMTLAMMGLGWMADHLGLLAPILAHTLIDVVLLERLHADWRRTVAGKEGGGIDGGVERSEGVGGGVG